MTNQPQLVGVGGAIYSSGGSAQFVKGKVEAVMGDMEGEGGAS